MLRENNVKEKANTVVAEVAVTQMIASNNARTMTKEVKDRNGHSQNKSKFAMVFGPNRRCSRSRVDDRNLPKTVDRLDLFDLSVTDLN